MPSVDYASLRELVSLAEVLELVGFSAVEQRGDQLRGPCPLHEGPSANSRSFSANLGKNAYRCFVCGSSGNQLDLWVAATGLELHQAAISLCERLDRDLPLLPG
ncbi:MAG TPA: CHC2 zinc finger domain-containing protein, partial [Pirellulales bacterium]|nr:CHC2 zinc finger domain-containing protein [Pirellulales bacterium]